MSAAVAVTGTTVPVMKLEPFAGEVIATVGGGLLATVIETAAEVVCAPLLSVALTVKL